MNERDDKYASHDEGEYHFSDEHATYDMDTETAKVGNVAVAKDSPFAALTKSKRAILALSVFFTLMFIVYKLLTPASSDPIIKSDAIAVNQPKTVVTTKTVAQPVPPQNNLPEMAQMLAPQMPVSAPTAVASTLQQSSPTVTTSQQEALASDRLSSLEQQTIKLTDELHNDFQQKLAENDAQSAATQAKLQELTTRVAGIETALAQITQLLQNQQKSTVMAPAHSGKTSEARSMYSVQAIIPGRAWLKSETGDTVTVAEGDILRDYGRVSKIDPYDGVVNIDTGNKVISLSYGASSD